MGKAEHWNRRSVTTKFELRTNGDEFIVGDVSLIAFPIITCSWTPSVRVTPGGMVDKSKNEYLKLLPAVYEVIPEISSRETGAVVGISYIW